MGASSGSGAVLGGRPVAELRPVPATQPGPRQFGLCAGAFTVPDDFDAPLAEEILRAFEGRCSSNAPHRSTVTWETLTGVIGRSPAPVGVVSIFFTTSMPSITLPNTGCFDGPGVNQSR